MSATPPRFQIVVCTGPRCRARGQVHKHIAHLEGRIAEPANAGRVGLAHYECLSRCPAGPNVLVRSFTKDEDIAHQPGMLDLDGGCHYHGTTIELLDRILDAHNAGTPIEGRYQRY